eukprot:1589899-Pyramimonas_sp.AAC.1
MPAAPHSLRQLTTHRRDPRPYGAGGPYPSHKPLVVLGLVTPDEAGVEGSLTNQMAQEVVLADD